MKIKFTLLFSLIIFIQLNLCAQDFEVAPVVMQFKTNPGETESRVLTVKNYYAETQKFTLNLVDYTLDDQGNKHSASLGSTERSLANRLIVNPSVVELKPNESAEIEVIMTVPKTDSKTRWGMIQVQVAKEKTTADADKNMATGVIIIPRIVVIVTQSPANNTNFAASVESLKEIDPNENGLRQFEVTIINSGDKVISGKLYLALANLETAEEKRYPSKEVTIYPDATKVVTLILPDIIAKGKYALAALYDYGSQKAIEGTQILIDQE